MKRIIVALLFSLFLPTVFATEPPQWYQVEVLVFQHTNMDEALKNEHWPAVERQQPDNLVQLMPAEDSNEETPLALPYRILPSTQWLMSNTHHILENKDEYQVLLHKAWLQPIDESSAKSFLHLTGGDQYDEQNTWEVDGTLNIVKKHYLDTSVDLVLSLPVSGLSDTTNIVDKKGLAQFTLKQTQRMRSKELHYFDNPFFGVLVEVVRVKDES